MNRICHLLKFLNYLLKAKGEHSIHSPLVYDFYTKVIKAPGPFYAYEDIESIRAQMLLSDKEISVTDHGTGKSGNRRINSIAQRSLKRAKYGQLLFRIINSCQPKNIIEFGTSLGITTSYLAASRKNSRVITLEGCKKTAAIAQRNFDLLKLDNIELVIGNFNHTINKVTNMIDTIDFAFFDGNHLKEPTISYFETCLKRKTNDSIFIFDDIHWSLEMESAWNQIASHPEVSVSIDLFALGIIFFRKELNRENHILRY